MNKAFRAGLDGVYCIGLMGFSMTDCICSTPLLCFNSSTEQDKVNVRASVMTPSSLHLTGMKNFSELAMGGQV